MERYHRINLESSTRCKICQDIDEYIGSLTNEIKKNKELLRCDNSASEKSFIEAEIEDMQVQVKIANRVIDEILGNLRGDMFNVR